MGAGLAAVWLRARRADALPVYWTVPPFSLVDQHGHSRTRDDVQGAAWIADFIFTRCAGTCPTMTARMARLQSKIPPGARLVSITVDPDHDTSAVLQEYAANFEAGPSWMFLTGDRHSLYELATAGFKLQAIEVPAGAPSREDEGPFLHSSKFALVDAQSRVRGYYDSADDEAMARLLADLVRVAAERP
jgi:protein SCO1/2